MPRITEVAPMTSSALLKPKVYSTCTMPSIFQVRIYHRSVNSYIFPTRSPFGLLHENEHEMLCCFSQAFGIYHKTIIQGLYLDILVTNSTIACFYLAFQSRVVSLFKDFETYKTGVTAQRCLNHLLDSNALRPK